MGTCRRVRSGSIALLTVAVLVAGVGARQVPARALAAPVPGIATAGAFAPVRLCAARRPQPASLQRARRIIRLRLTVGLRLSSARVAIAGERCLRLTIPPVAHRHAVIALLAARGRFVFTAGDHNILQLGQRVRLGAHPSSPPGRPPVLIPLFYGSGIVRSSVTLQPMTPTGLIVVLQLKPAAAATWCRYTRTHVGSYAPMVMDGRVVTDPIVESAICFGSMQVMGSPGAAPYGPGGAKRIAIDLRFGTLPFALHLTAHASR